MIHAGELSAQGNPRAWFAYDKEDLSRKMVTLATHGGVSCIYWNESEAVGAFEGGDPRIAGKAPWHARRDLFSRH